MRRRGTTLKEMTEQDVHEAIERTRANLNELYEGCQIFNQEIIAVSQKLDELIVQAMVMKMKSKSSGATDMKK